MSNEWEKFAVDYLGKYEGQGKVWEPEMDSTVKKIGFDFLVPKTEVSPLKEWSNDLIETAMRAALERAAADILRRLLDQDICLIRIPEWRIREITGEGL